MLCMEQVIFKFRLATVWLFLILCNKQLEEKLSRSVYDLCTS